MVIESSAFGSQYVGQEAVITKVIIYISIAISISTYMYAHHPITILFLSLLYKNIYYDYRLIGDVLNSNDLEFRRATLVLLLNRRVSFSISLRYIDFETSMCLLIRCIVSVFKASSVCPVLHLIRICISIYVYGFVLLSLS